MAAGPAEATRASTEGRSVEAIVDAEFDVDETDATDTMVLDRALLAAAAEELEFANGGALLSIMMVSGDDDDGEEELETPPESAMARV